MQGLKASVVASGQTSSGSSMDRKVALLIPHYNDREGLLKSVVSVVEDVLVDLFVVDDGSLDVPPQGEIRAAFKPAGNVCLIRLAENGGIEAALNAGLREIVGRGYEYVARLDAGDVCLPNRLQKQSDFLDANPAVALVGSWAEFVDEAGKQLFVLRHPCDPAVIKKRMYLNNMFVHPSVMFRSSAVREIGFYPLGYAAIEDYAYFFEFTKRYLTSNVPLVLIKYEVSSKAISTTMRRQQVMSRIKLILRNFYFGWYPIYGLARNLVLLFVPRSLATNVKKILWNR
jgi:glycosyltransferase involved in cell wall biosynthesis